jgi:hypothetical protein
MNKLLGRNSPRELDYTPSEPKAFGSQSQAQAAASFADLLQKAQMQNFSKP